MSPKRYDRYRHLDTNSLQLYEPGWVHPDLIPPIASLPAPFRALLRDPRDIITGTNLPITDSDLSLLPQIRIHPPADPPAVPRCSETLPPSKWGDIPEDEYNAAASALPLDIFQRLADPEQSIHAIYPVACHLGNQRIHLEYAVHPLLAFVNEDRAHHRRMFPTVPVQTAQRALVVLYMIAMAQKWLSAVPEDEAVRVYVVSTKINQTAAIWWADVRRNELAELRMEIHSEKYSDLKADEAERTRFQLNVAGVLKEVWAKADWEENEDRWPDLDDIPMSRKQEREKERQEAGKIYSEVAGKGYVDSGDGEDPAESTEEDESEEEESPPFPPQPSCTTPLPAMSLPYDRYRYCDPHALQLYEPGWVHPDLIPPLDFLPVPFRALLRDPRDVITATALPIDDSDLSLLSKIRINPPVPPPAVPRCTVMPPSPWGEIPADEYQGKASALPVDMMFRLADQQQRIHAIYPAAAHLGNQRIHLEYLPHPLLAFVNEDRVHHRRHMLKKLPVKTSQRVLVVLHLIGMAQKWLSAVPEEESVRLHVVTTKMDQTAAIWWADVRREDLRELKMEIHHETYSDLRDNEKERIKFQLNLAGVWKEAWNKADWEENLDRWPDLDYIPMSRKQEREKEREEAGKMYSEVAGKGYVDSGDGEGPAESEDESAEEESPRGKKGPQQLLHGWKDDTDSEEGEEERSDEAEKEEEEEAHPASDGESRRSDASAAEKQVRSIAKPRKRKSESPTEERNLPARQTKRPRKHADTMVPTRWSKRMADAKKLAQKPTPQPVLAPEQTRKTIRKTKTAAAAPPAVKRTVKSRKDVKKPAPKTERGREKPAALSPKKAGVQKKPARRKQTAAKKEAPRKEPARKELTSKESAKKSAKKESSKESAKESSKESSKESAEKESARKGSAKKKTAKKESSKESAKKGSAKKEPARKGPAQEPNTTKPHSARNGPQNKGAKEPPQHELKPHNRPAPAGQKASGKVPTDSDVRKSRSGTKTRTRTYEL